MDPNQILQIQLESWHILFGIIGFILPIGIAWGRSQKSIEKMTEKLANIDSTLKEVRKDLAIAHADIRVAEQRINSIEKKADYIEDRIDTFLHNKLAPANSPRQLNKKGSLILAESGIQEMVLKNRDDLLAKIREKELTNRYDAQERIENIMSEFLILFPQYEDQIKDGAFKTGVSVQDILFVGSIYLRDLIFADLGFSVQEVEDKKTRMTA